MKKIVPFNNVLTFNTDVREITAISLEHDIKTSKEAISGTFYITGEYKMTYGSLEKEKFSFDLPFDIALGCDYKLDTLVIDIDDFHYKLLDNNKLKVNIDLYIDGEIIEPMPEVIPKEELLFTEKEFRELAANLETDEPVKLTEPDASSQPTNSEADRDLTDIFADATEKSKTLFDEMLENKKEEPMKEKENVKEKESIKENKENKGETVQEKTEHEVISNINNLNDTNISIDNINDNHNDNIFNGFNEEEQYITYHVYPVTENDTLDKIIEKYNVTKEDLAKYNDIEDIHPGDKLIIPANKND